MKKKITILSVLLFALSLCLVKPIVTTEHNKYNVNNEKDVLAENLEMYFMQNGSRISSITIAPGGSATVDFYINVEGAQARFAQTAIAGINLRNGINTTTVKVASDMPEGLYYLVGSYNGYSVMIDINVVKPHECSYVSKTISNATCTSEGVISNVCECGSSYETKIPKLNHTYNSVVVNPTCSKEGYTKNTCTVCSYSYNSNTTNKLAHTLSTLPAKDATCTTTGLTAGSKCTVCNTVVTEQQVVPKLTHNYTDWTTTITPSCTKEGKKQRTCQKCNNIEVVNLEKTDHTWNNTYTVDKNATCTTTGSKSIHCKNCAATKDSQTIAKKEHIVVTVPATNATCTSTGLTAGSKCSVCNVVITAQQTTAKLSHSYNNWTVTSNATCVKEGKKQRKCQRCNNVEVVSLEKTDHAWNSTYTVDKNATCTTTGSKSIHCKNCTATKDSQTIAKKEHTVIAMPAKEATCTSTGLTAGSKCSACNLVITAQQTTAIASHNYNSWSTISIATCEKEGREQRICQRCNNVEVKTLNKTSHNWNSTYTVDKEATCVSEGSKSIHCKNCDTKKDTKVVTKTEHNWNSNYTVDKNATCTTEGSKSIHCKNCSSTKNVTTIPKNQHNVINANEKDVHTKCSICNETISTEHSFKLSSTKKETCLSAGKYTYTCDCGYSYVETKPLLKHVDTDGNNSCDNCSLLLLTEDISNDNNKCTTCNGTGKSLVPLKLKLHNHSIFRVHYNKYDYTLNRLSRLNLSPLYVNKKLNTNYMGTTILPILNDKCRDCLGTGINKLIKDPSFT